MQLANRPHPPPVPPRPSRQVVAEALKRTPKLPCPTRQAPPPPNTKPWRPSNILEKGARVDAAAGRTLIYESPKDQATKSINRDPEKRPESQSERIENNQETQKPQKPSELITKNDENSQDNIKINNHNNNDVDLKKNAEGQVIADELIEILNTKLSDCATIIIVDESDQKITINDENNDNIQHEDWLEAGIRYSSTKITLGDDKIDHRSETNENFDFNYENEKIQFDLNFSSIRERIAMSSLQGLPPLPRSLSGFNLSEGRRDSGEPPPPPPTRSSSKTSKSNKTQLQSSSRPSPPSRQLTTLDTQLAILRKEMFGLRQLDLSLLSQLWSLNESIQEFRQLLQEQEDRAPSSSPSSEDGDESTYHGHPPPPPRRPAPLLHHHRPPRPPRPLRPPPSDDSPSSEEYGAV